MKRVWLGILALCVPPILVTVLTVLPATACDLPAGQTAAYAVSQVSDPARIDSGQTGKRIKISISKYSKVTKTTVGYNFAVPKVLRANVPGGTVTSNGAGTRQSNFRDLYVCGDCTIAAGARPGRPASGGPGTATSMNDAKRFAKGPRSGGYTLGTSKEFSSEDSFAFEQPRKDSDDAIATNGGAWAIQDAEVGDNCL